MHRPSRETNSLSSRAARAKNPTSTQNKTLQIMGMDVIKQYPGPLTVVSRAVLMTSRPAPGQALFPHLTGAEQNASYAGTAVEFTVSTATSPPPRLHRPPTRRTPIELRRCRFGCAILGLGQAADPPSADPLRDVDMSLL